MSKKRYRSMLPLFPMAIEGFNLNGYDLIISTSHCVAKGIIPGPNTLHISYIFTPMRYVWDRYHDYFGATGGLKGKIVSIFAHYLRLWDSTSSNRVDHFVAISRHVSNRVKKYYRREAEVIYPPVDFSRFSSSTDCTGNSPIKDEKDYYLIVSAFAPYKRIDLAIEAFRNLGLKLKIIGSGQDEKKLRAMASTNVEFLGWKTDLEIADYYKNCKALIFPGEEDFGIVPLEAMASGRPVIAYGRGGALETVKPLHESGEGQATGVFFFEPDSLSLAEAVRTFEKEYKAFDPENIKAHARTFDKPIFKNNIREYILTQYKKFREEKTC